MFARSPKVQFLTDWVLACEFSLIRETLGHGPATGRCAGGRIGCVLTGMLLIFVGFCAASGHAEADEPVEFNLFQLGSSQVANRILQSPTRFLLDQQPLREAMGVLSQTHSLSLWVDRRLDPTQAISYAPQAVAEASAVWPKNSLGSRLVQVAKSCKAEVGLMENVFYFGPIGETAKLQRAAAELHDAIHRSNPLLAAELRPLKWRELLTAQELLEQVAQQWGVTIEGSLPHDLMHAGQLQTPATLATQLTLVTGSFRRELEVSGPRSLVLRPLREEAVWTARYPKKELQVNALAVARADYPQGSLRCRNDGCTLQGVTDFHLALLAAPSAARGAKAAGSRTAWSFEISNAPAEAILDNLAAGIDLNITWDARCTAEQRSQLLTLKVEQASLDELLTQVCEAAGLAYTRQEKEVRLRPK